MRTLDPMATNATHGARPIPRPSGVWQRLFPYRLPPYAYVGALLNLLAWASLWGQIGYWIDPFSLVWLGFILVLDGLNVARTGTSPLRRSWRRFALLFAFSCPFWWIFEGLNVPVQNWHYTAPIQYFDWQSLLFTSLDFSTVLPAVFEMTELLASVPPLRPRLRPPQVGPRLPLPAALGLFGMGGVLFWLPFAFPTAAFSLVWLCLIFLLDPINNWARRKSAAGHLLSGDWRFFVTVPLAGLASGFFWELWNSRAIVRWYYTVPGMDGVPHLFAMPLPGYLGYLPFGVELFVMYQFALLLTRQKHDALDF
jgi:hypothetical protein